MAGETEGLLLVDKPAGVSSHDVVLAARRALGIRRIGHAGTLDPFATGLLVLLAGRATRLMDYLPDEPKVYEAHVRFGVETDTGDPGGAALRKAQLPSPDALRTAAAAFRGRIMQEPPAYSAKRVAGRRAYQLARAGEAVTLAPVPVEIHELTLSEFEEEGGGVARCRMRVSCSGGTYVRALARDIARAAGSAAHLETLRRHSAGAFEVGRAIPMERLAPDARLAPPIDALVGYPVQTLDAAEIAQVVRGIDVEARADGRFAALVDPAAPVAAAALVAFGERRPSERGDRWQPRVVLRER